MLKVGKIYRANNGYYIVKIISMHQDKVCTYSTDCTVEVIYEKVCTGVLKRESFIMLESCWSEYVELSNIWLDLENRLTSVCL